MTQSIFTQKIALGAWAWGTGFAGGDQVFGNQLTAKELEPVFERAVELGLTLWDTAAVYGMGSSEEILGSFIKNYPRDNLTISTKFTPQIAKETEHPAQVMLDESKQRLHIDYADIYWIHNNADVEQWTPELIPLAKSGQIKHIGLSNHNLAEIKRANDILAQEGLKVSAIQNHYSLLHRVSEETGILDYCKEHGITFFSYMVLEQGALSGKYSSQHPFGEGTARAASYNQYLPKIEKLNKVLEHVAVQHHASIAQVATAWAMAKGTLPIIGVTTVKQVEDAAQAVGLELSLAQMNDIETEAAKLGISTIREWETTVI